jgi:RNA polymerase sigma factor (sigma-70 family)
MQHAPASPVLSPVSSLAVSLRRAEQTDGELLRGFVDGDDQQAFAVLVRRHGPHVLATCRRVLNRVQDAEDAFQATFLLLARRALGFLNADSVGGWLHEVGYRTAMTMRRPSSRRRRHEERAATPQPHPATAEAARRELQHLLDEAVSSLPSAYREPFVLCCLENLGCAEVACRLRIKEGTVWSRVAEARKRLQRSLTRRGVAPGLALGVAALGLERALAQVPHELIARTAQAAALWTGGREDPEGDADVGQRDHHAVGPPAGREPGGDLRPPVGRGERDVRPEGEALAGAAGPGQEFVSERTGSRAVEVAHGVARGGKWTGDPTRTPSPGPGSGRS